MKNELKFLGVVLLIVILVAAVGALSNSDQEKGKMHMKGMMGSMDKMMGECNQMMEGMDMMMGEKMSDECMGMMNMKNMMMRMHGMSDHMKKVGQHMSETENHMQGMTNRMEEMQKQKNKD